MTSAWSDLRRIRQFVRSDLRLIRTRALAESPDIVVSDVPAPSHHPVTNPSLIWWDGRHHVALREVTYRLGRDGGGIVEGHGEARSRTWLAEFDAVTMTASRPRLLTSDSHLDGDNLEDPRLFVCGTTPHVIWTRGARVEGGWHNEMVVARVDLARSTADGHLTLPSPGGADREKNWMPFHLHDEHRYLDDVSTMSVHRWSGDSSTLVTEHPASPQLLGHRGGSALIPVEDGWLGIVHRSLRFRRTPPLLKAAYYVHRFIRIDSTLSTISAGPEFTFEGPGVEFCAGLAPGPDGTLLMSYGVGDRVARIMRLPAERLTRLLGPSRW